MEKQNIKTEFEIVDFEEILKNYYQTDENIHKMIAKFVKKMEEKKAEKFVPSRKNQAVTSILRCDSSSLE